MKTDLTFFTNEPGATLIERIEHMDFLFGEPRFIRSLDPDNSEKKAFIIDSSRLKLATSIDHENRK